MTCSNRLTDCHTYVGLYKANVRCFCYVSYVTNTFRTISSQAGVFCDNFRCARSRITYNWSTEYDM